MNWCLIRHHDTSKDVLRIDHESPRGHIADTDVTPTRDHFGELFILLLKLTRCESELLPCSSASLPAGKPWAQSVGGSQCKLMLLASVGAPCCPAANLHLPAVTWPLSLMGVSYLPWVPKPPGGLPFLTFS